MVAHCTKKTVMRYNDICMKGHNHKRIHLPESEQQYLVWIMKIGQMITNQFNTGLARYGLTFNQSSVLFVLHGANERKKEISIQQLGDMMMMTKPNVSRLVDHLQKEKYVLRYPSPIDRRVSFLRLTKKGGEMVRDLQKQWPLPEIKKLYVVLHSLRPETRKHVNDFFLKISEAITIDIDEEG